MKLLTAILTRMPVIAFSALVVGLAAPSHAAAVTPASVNSWVQTAPLPQPRDQASAAVLDDGRVLVVGGYDPTASLAEPLAPVIYDPSTDTWTKAALPNVAQFPTFATTLASGKVLAIQGGTTELFDPSSRTWSSTGSMSVGRDQFAAVVLADGRVAVFGGVSASRSEAVEIYDPSTGVWTRTGDLLTPRSDATATLLPDGDVLVAGGAGPSGATLASAEIYDPVAGTSSPASSMSVPRVYATSVALPNGNILMAGGMNDSGSDGIVNAEIYRPDTNDWVAAGVMSPARIYGQLACLANGKCLYVGGRANGFASAATEIFDPATNSWRPGATMTMPHLEFPLVHLGDGSIMAIGGTLSAQSGGDTLWTGDTTAPSAPAFTSPANNGWAHLSSILLSGTSEPYSIVELREGTSILGTTSADASGTWSEPVFGVSDGPHVYTARSWDASGNTSPDSTARTVNVDTAAPAAPSITSPVDGSDSNAGSMMLAGQAESHSTVNIYDGASSLGSVVADGTGHWSKALSSVADGSHAFTATASDAAGNTSPASAVTHVTVDTQAPAAPSITSPVDGSYNNNGTVTLAGQAEQNSIVNVYADGGLKGPVAVDATGHWAKTLPSVADGSHAFTATATDAAGNTGPASAVTRVTVDTQAPAAPSITSPVDGSDSNAGSMMLAGQAESHSTVNIYDGASSLGSVVADGTGHWSKALSSVADGSHAFTATASDAAGNTSPASAVTHVTVDTQAPAAPSITSPVDGSYNHANTLTVSGAAERDTFIAVYLDGLTRVGSATTNSAGQWSTAVTAVPDGSHSFTATATDAAGNTSRASAAVHTAVDTTSSPPAPSPSPPATTPGPPKPSPSAPSNNSPPATADPGSSVGQSETELLEQLASSGTHVKIGARLNTRAHKLTFRALSPGHVEIRWYYVRTPTGPVRASGNSRPALIAKGSAECVRAGQVMVTIKVTKTGHRMLKQAKRLKLAATGTYTPTGHPALRVSENITLKR